MALRIPLEGDPTILTIPDALEWLLDIVEPDFLGYEATFHSNRCYTVTVLTLDYRYRSFRCNLSLDNRWTLNPLDYHAIMPSMIPIEG